MTFLLDLTNGVHKLLDYLDISLKYPNRGYTTLSVIPVLYLLRIVYGLWQNQNYSQLSLYGLALLVLVCLTVLNVFCYFLDKNTKVDVTQLFMEYLPDEAFNIQIEESIDNGSSIDRVNTQEVMVSYDEGHQLKLAEDMWYLIGNNEIRTNELSRTDGLLVDRSTLYPYYYVKKTREKEYALNIGRSYSNMEEVGIIRLDSIENTLELVGLFTVGDDFVKDGLRYHKPYRLELIAKKIQSQEEPVAYSRSQRRRHP